MVILVEIVVILDPVSEILGVGVMNSAPNIAWSMGVKGTLGGG